MPVAHHATRLRERRFYIVTAVLIAVVTFLGFMRTYYLRSYFRPTSLTPFLHVHGAVMTAWVLLFLLQAVLIAAHRVRLHRAFGWFGAGLAVLVVAMGCSATVMAAAREVRGHTEFVPLQLSILGLELTQMALFAAFVAIAIALRRRLDLHKRCMLLATLCLLPNPEIRLMPFIQNNLVVMAIWSAQVFLLVALDAVRAGRIHRPLLRGAIVANLALYAAYFVSETEPWRHFASRLVS